MTHARTQAQAHDPPTPKFKNKQQIKQHILEHDGIFLEALHMVGGAVRFGFNQYGNVRVGGFAEEWEKSITTLEDLVDYVWTERKRVLE